MLPQLVDIHQDYRQRAFDPADDTNGVSGTIHVVREFLGSVSVATPTVSGTARVGQPLTAKPGSWTPATASPTYQWYRTTSKGVTTPIDGAVAAKYTVGAADVAMKLSVKLTCSQEGWKPASKTSKVTATVVAAAFTQAPIPTIDDPTPAVGNTLTAYTGVWEPQPVTLTYRWYKVSSKGKVTALASTIGTYQVQASDAGYRLKVRVSGSKPGYTSLTRESKLTSAVPKA